MASDQDEIRNDAKSAGDRAREFEQQQRDKGNGRPPSKGSTNSSTAGQGRKR